MSTNTVTIDIRPRELKKVPRPRPAVATSGRPYRLGFVFPDAHVKDHDPDLWDAMLAYMADETWDEVIGLGDFLDLSCLASFNDAYPGLVAGQTILGDALDARELLDRITRACREHNPGCRITLLEGNHEYRLLREMDKQPKLSGILNADSLLGLEERGIDWVPSWSTGEVYRIGDAIFTHGLYTIMGHARKHGLAYGGKVYYGHVHDVQETHVLTLGGTTIMGKSLGCTCLSPEWMHGKPDNWVQAFSVFWFFPDGTHQEVCIKPVNGTFVGITNGKVYGPRRKHGSQQADAGGGKKAGSR